MYACMHVCMYACMHVCMCACMHVCMYTVSKIYERNMYTDIDSYMKDHMSPFLNGFRKGYSTQHCLVYMIEKMKKTLDKQHYVAALLTDRSIESIRLHQP